MQRRAAARVRREERRIADAVLAWYDRERRRLPWRAEPGEAPDPYRVWLSEIMLQQTTVKAVLPRYDLFLRRWPDVAALARAELGEVLAAWAGLGYYARARNLHACARVVAERHGGKFPEDEAALRKLPGVGDYTAAAIAAIAFGKRATPVDGNIERVVARLFAVTTPLPAAKTEIRALAETLTPDDAVRRLRPGDDGSWAPRSARRAGRLAASARCGPTAGAYADGLAEALPYRDGEGRAAGQARRNLRCRPRRWRRAAPRAAVAWPIGRHAGDALIALGGGRARRKLRAAIRAGRGRLAQAARPGRAHFHAFSSGAFRLSRGGRTGCAAKARGGARALPLAQTSRARGRRAAVGHAEGVAARARRRARRQPCGSSFARAASRKASIGLRRPSRLVMPEGPAVAGERALHMRADLVDRALRAGAGDRAVGADFRLVPRAGIVKHRAGRDQPKLDQRAERDARLARVCPWRLAANPCSSGESAASRAFAASA